MLKEVKHLPDVYYMTLGKSLQARFRDVLLLKNLQFFRFRFWEGHQNWYSGLLWSLILFQYLDSVFFFRNSKLLPGLLFHMESLSGELESQFQANYSKIAGDLVLPITKNTPSFN